MENRNNYDKAVFWWLLSGCFLVFLMVVVGGITRLTGSGLSITEWKVIMGAIPPLNETQWNEAFEKYKQIPQFKLINHYFTLSDFKQIYFWEWFHRLIGRLIGLAFIFPFLYFLFKRRFVPGLMPKLLGIFALGGLQGVIGWYMVSSGLTKLTWVSHYRLALHLITALATFGFIYWVALGLVNNREKVPNPEVRKLRQYARIVFALIIVQIIYGAFVAGLHAGFEINTWPLMNGRLFFTESFDQDNFWLNFLNNKAGVQIVHRYLAVVVALLVLLLVYKTIKTTQSLFVRNAAQWLGAAVSLQFVLGVITILFVNRQDFKVVLGVLHQCGAFFLLASFIYYFHRLSCR